MSATIANSLFTDLTSGASFDVPLIDLDSAEFAVPGGATTDIYDPVLKLTNADLTTKTIDGAGTFDWIMASISVHLRDEFTKGRIVGAEYTKAYIALMSAALQTSVTFLVQRDASYWASAAAQIAAITGKVQLGIAKMQFAGAQADAYLKQAQYAASKMQLPLLEAQAALIKEQQEVQRAQTLDTRMDGTTPVAGVLKKQKDLITQQITSFLRDAEIKAGKMFADSWSVQKTIDEGLAAPTAFTNTTIDAVMASIKTNNNL